MAMLPPDKRSPMIPEPTTAASNSAVPAVSETGLRAMVGTSSTGGNRLDGPNKCAEKLPVHLRGDRVYVNALTAEKCPGIRDPVDPRRLDTDLLESRRLQLRLVLVL